MTGNMFEVIKELVKFMEDEKDKYPNLIKFLKEKFKGYLNTQ